MRKTKRLQIKVIYYERAEKDPLLDTLAKILHLAELDPDEAADVAIRVLAPSGWVYHDPPWFRAAWHASEWIVPALFRRDDMDDDTYITFYSLAGRIRPIIVEIGLDEVSPKELIADSEWNQSYGYWWTKGVNQRYIAECDPIAWAREELKDGEKNELS